MYEYRVVPFIGQVKEGEKDIAQKVAAQLQEIINQEAQQGWEYVSVDRIQIAVKPGCLGGLGGVKVAAIGFDQVVFRKQR